MSAPIWDSLDGALLGYMESEGRKVAVYSYLLAIECLVEDGMDPEDVEDYLQFNVIGAYIGEQTPVWVYPIPDEDLEWGEDEE